MFIIQVNINLRRSHRVKKDHIGDIKAQEIEGDENHTARCVKEGVWSRGTLTTLLARERVCKTMFGKSVLLDFDISFTRRISTNANRQIYYWIWPIHKVSLKSEPWFKLSRHKQSYKQASRQTIRQTICRTIEAKLRPHNVLMPLEFQTSSIGLPLTSEDQNNWKSSPY